MKSHFVDGKARKVERRPREDYQVLLQRIPDEQMRAIVRSTIGRGIKRCWAQASAFPSHLGA